MLWRLKALFGARLLQLINPVASVQFPAQTAVQPHSAVELPFQSTASIDESQMLTPPQSTNGSTSSMEEEDLDENLLYIGSPKVGILRRGRYIKGKKIGKGPLIEVVRCMIHGNAAVTGVKHVHDAAALGLTGRQCEERADTGLHRAARHICTS